MLECIIGLWKSLGRESARDVGHVLVRRGGREAWQFNGILLPPFGTIT